MTSLLRRLRRGLPPHYEVERRLASGGMAHVFVGRDRRLDRPVAVKVLRPELATARGAERFLREARILARLSHPSLLPVYDVGEAGGLHYMVLALAGGRTLRDRLEDGSMEVEEALELGRDLLDALAVVHAEGVVHRDVKPSNVYCMEGRAVLGDFGVAVDDRREAEPLTRTGETVGTPAYLAPEVAAGGQATPRSDVYAAGMTLYEAATGRRWSPVDEPADGALRDVPQPLRDALERALARKPEARWSHAGAFRDALSGSRRRGGVVMAAGIVAVVVVVSAVTWSLSGGLASGGTDGNAELSDVAILPCETVPAADSVLGVDLARLVALDLRGLPDLRVTRAQTAFAWWRARQIAGPDATPETAAGALRSRFAVRCTLLRRPPGLEARLELEGADGGTAGTFVVRAPATDPPVPLGDSAAVALLRGLEAAGLPSGVLSAAGTDALAGRPFPAVRAFLRGEEAFQRSAWDLADDAYLNALDLDGSFTLARWRLVDVHRWQREPVGVDLRRLREEGGAGLGPLDRRLLEARLAPHGPEQHALYRRILEDFPNDAYAMLLYGDELLHRGPLFGVPLDSARAVLRRSAARDSFFSPTLDHLVQAEIRLGLEEAARVTLDRLWRVSAAPGEVEVHMPTLLEQAWNERFRPAEAAGRREVLLEAMGTGQRSFLSAYARLAGPVMDLPAAGLAFGRRLGELADRAGDSPVDAQVASGLALYALGRTGQALALFDSAAASAGTGEGRLQAAEWRVLPPALGLTGPPAEERERGRAVLAVIAGDAGADPVRRLRAASALALLARREGRAEEAERWRREVEGLPAELPGRERQGRLLDAAARAAAGDPGEALALSAPLLAYDSAAQLERPFERSTVAVLRGEWQSAGDDHRAAELSWRWHENSDLALAPADPFLAGRFAQAGEVDWALGTEARVKAASAAMEAGRRRSACRLAGEALRHLQGAGERVRPVGGRAAELARRACSR